MKGSPLFRWGMTVMLLGCFTWGCAAPTAPSRITVKKPASVDSAAHGQDRRSAVDDPITDTGWTMRAVTHEELEGWSDRDPELTPVRCREILSRLNIKASYLITEDMDRGRTLKVPNDFRAYRDWTPMPRSVPGLSRFPKAIVITKDISFIGWYARGALVGDAFICVGKSGDETRSGSYRVLEKDPDHYSRSYPNAYGEPAWMPWALRIYERVWIHAGDITGPYCSPGCVILPMKPAEDLFRWADPGTPVLVLDSLKDLDGALKRTAEAPPGLAPRTPRTRSN